jgi:hypothetical protein
VIEQETRRERDELTELDSSPVNRDNTRLFLRAERPGRYLDADEIERHKAEMA